MLALLISFCVVLLDQIVKFWVCDSFYPGQTIVIVPGFFSLSYVRNTGAAWGMFGGFNGWLALLSIVILILLVLFRRSFLTDVLIHRVALGLMAGGIVGNLIDRLRLHFVIDYLDFHWGTHPFPAFNVADASICVGVFLYMLSAFVVKSHPLNGNGAPPTDGPAPGQTGEQKA